MRLRKAAPFLLALCLGCATANNERFCSEVERLGWFDDPLMRYLSSDKFGMFSPDAFYPKNERNPYHNPTPADTVNCFCYSKERQQTLAVCPSDPWTPKGEKVPEWHARRLAHVERVVESYRKAGSDRH